MENNKQNAIRIGIFALIIGIVIVGMSLIAGGAEVSTKYDGFAQCLSDKGAKFYGAFWCPHCQDQKKAFGGSAKLLPYTECSTADGKVQNALCTDAGVASYPTWEFADGTRSTGFQSLEVLAAKTGCELPAAE